MYIVFLFVADEQSMFLRALITEMYLLLINENM